MLFLSLLFALPTAAQTENLVSKILAQNTDTERKNLLENRSESELIKLVDDLLTESEKKTDPATRAAVLEIARQTAEKINYKIGLAQTLYRFGAISFDVKFAAQRNDFFARAVRLMEEANAPKQLAVLLDATGYVRTRTGDYEQSLEDYKRASKIYEDLGETKSAARTLQGMGAVYMYLGDYNQSEAALRKTLTIAEKTNWKEGVAGALFHLGIINRFRGNYADALRLYQESREISDSLAIADPNTYQSVIATTLRHIAGTYFLQGNLRLALDYANQALALDERRKDALGTAYSLQMIALIRVAEKNFAEALPIAERTVSMFGTGDNDGLARSLALAGNIYLSIGNYDKALENLDKALKMREASNSRDGMATARIAMARVFLAQRKYGEALALADLAAASARDNGNRELLWQAQSLAGQIYLAQNEYDKTRESFDAAIGTIESLRGEIVGGASENSLFFAERTMPYQLLAAMLAREDNFNEAFEYAERAKARVLLDTVKFGRNQRAAILSDEEKAEENRLRGNVSSWNAQIAKAGGNTEKGVELKQKLEEARTALARFQTSLYAKHPELRIKRGAIKPVEINEVANLLGEKSVLLEYLVSGDDILLFVFTKEGGAVEFKTYRLNIKKEELRKNISRFRGMLAERNVLFAAESKKLYDALLKPAAAQLAGKTDLTIVPDDGLWELPFQALQSADNHYVLDDASVAYAPSLTILRELRAAQNKGSSNNIIAFGNPAEKGTKIVNTDFAALPEAERQTAALKTLYGAGNIRIFNRTEADESVFKRETQKEFSILHLATHGVLDNNSPLNSYVLLAPDEKSGEDGKLEAWEILEMNLNSDLIFLSACETARGQARSGEGLVGLAWSLMVAGTHNVVVSQWKVEAASTTDLTVEFYKHLKKSDGANKGESLRQAALKLRRNPLTAHPFYWAGFVLIGEGR